ncbi:MAG TPA: Rossmann-like and DUF2520 domain-containing protein [Bryobacteraceae bacterium]|nr:Rossmann-like and DUF2520 domain-containing protein [Bryobacteraceae bacterium]
MQSRKAPGRSTAWPVKHYPTREIRGNGPSWKGVPLTTTPFAIIGTGRVASSLGRVLRERGAPLQWIAGRDPQRTRIAADFVGGVEALPLESVPSAATRVLIAVSDSAIIEVAQQLASAGFKDGIALHTAGSRGPEVLAPLAAARVSSGVLYPLQTFPTPEQGALSLPGTYFAVTGDQRAQEWARQIVDLIPGNFLSLAPKQWALCHAAAVLASNYQVTLLDAALEALEHAGVTPEEGLAALAPLVRATLENVLRLGPQRALTGPISRGDCETVRRNREALEAVSPATQELYRAAARRTIPIAQRRGLPVSLLEELEKSL